MRQRLQTLLAKGDALSSRERAILFVLLLAGAWAVVDASLMAPLEQARRTEADRIQEAKGRIQQAQDALTQRQSQVPPDVAAVQRLEAARAAFNARMQEAGRLQGHMVAPKDMPGVLQGLTRSTPGLRLVSLRSLAPEAVGPAAAHTDGPSGVAAAQPRVPGLYKHGVTLTLSGSYEALVRYMEALEKLPVRFFWARAELDASGHPDIRLTLTLNTLSLEREWLTL